MSMMAERDMGRILLDLSDDVIQRLDDLKVQRNIPRAELLREAVEQYLEKQDRAKDTISSALGLWQDCEAIKQRAGVAENVRLFWLHAFSCRMVRCHDCR